MVECCKLYFVEKRKFIDYYKKGFDNLKKGVQKMKVCEREYKIEGLKTMINYKDILTILISILGLVLSNLQVMELAKVSNNVEKLFVYNFIICSVIIFSNVYILLNKRKVSKIEEDKKCLEEKNKNLLEVTDNMRCFKHDFNNIIQAIDGYIYLDDMKSLAVYFKSLLKECNHVNTVDRLNAKIVDNPAIYGVLLDKYKIAENKNIKMNVDILTSLKELGERSYVISRMLGILIDNALEASCECEKKVVNIQILKDLKKKRINIVVENTYINKNVDTNRIFEKNYSTKKGNSGLGLWKIQDILSKDTSLDLFTSKDDEMFKQQLEIYENV